MVGGQSREGKVGRKRVLVMDDEEPVRSVFERMLAALRYDAVLVEDGMAAVEAYRDGPTVDVVILDLMVPQGLDGAATLKVLREIDPDVRVVVCSGYTETPEFKNFRDYGFRAQLPKPYTLDDLDRVIREALGP
ncbi:MAG: response regulator [Promethearchaeota archaeon]